MQFSHLLDVFLAGLISIAVIAILFTAKNTAGVITATGNATKGSLTAAEGAAA
jgi:hypothetical protein